MTVNFGAGGNASIESAVALTNCLVRLSRTNQTIHDVRVTLEEFQAKRQLRADLVCDVSGAIARREVLDSFANPFVAFHILPKLRTFIPDRTCRVMVDSELLEMLPIPKRALQGTMPHNSKQGVGKSEKKSLRALYAWPLLVFVFIAHRTMHGALGALPLADFLGSSLVLEKGLEVPLCLKYTGWKGVDSTLAMFAALFTSSFGDFDPAGRMQSIAFLAGDFVSLQVIFAIESIRRGNFLTFAHVL